MAQLSYSDISARVAALWNGPNAPTISTDGQQAMLVHPLGAQTSFDLRRADLMLSVEKFDADILLPAIEKLRALVAEQ